MKMKSTDGYTLCEKYLYCLSTAAYDELQLDGYSP